MFWKLVNMLFDQNFSGLSLHLAKLPCFPTQQASCLYLVCASYLYHRGSEFVKMKKEPMYYKIPLISILLDIYILMLFTNFCNTKNLNK